MVKLLFAKTQLVSTLNLKLWRDLLHIKGQAFTIALVVAAGVGAFIAQISTYTSLQNSRHDYYEQSRFAQVFANIKRAPESVVAQIRELPGVVNVQTSVVFDVTLDLPEVIEPVIGRMVSFSPESQSSLNQLVLRQGRWIENNTINEVLVSEGFAKARHLEPGDTLIAILNGKREILSIVGIALSPEYIYASRGGFLPDDKGFGVFWMQRERLAAAFNMEGAFNQVVLSLTAGTSTASVIDQLDNLLEPYGSLGAYDREEQISNKILSQEINQQKIMATIFPTIFLCVAAFLLNVVLSRQLATQRGEIAALKALGYADRSIAVHYLKLVILIVLFGIILGCLLGAWLGERMTELYTEFFHFPRLAYGIEFWIPLTAAAVTIAASISAVLTAAYRIMRLAPAEAMRPPSPTHYQRTLLERLGFSRLLIPQLRMILRNLERRPLRSALTTFGIACSVAVIVSGTFWRDAIDFLISVQFNAAEREDAQIIFTDPVAASTRYHIAHLDGVLDTEASRSVAIRLRNGHRDYLTAIIGLPEDARLRRLLDARQHPVALPTDGLLLTDRLASKLHLQSGDQVEIDVLEGTRIKRDVLVAGTVNDLIGMTAYMDKSALNRLLGEGDSISSVAITIDPRRRNDLFKQLKAIPRVATIDLKATALQSFRDTSARNMLVFTAIVTGFAVIMTIGVVYNSARIALAERAWELASLRVLGFTRGEVSTLLLGELAIELALAIPLGLWLGYLLSAFIVSFTHSESFSIPVIIESRTYAYAALVTIAAGIISSLIVRHRLDHLDLVKVLKTRE